MSQRAHSYAIKPILKDSPSPEAQGYLLNRDSCHSLSGNCDIHGTSLSLSYFVRFCTALRSHLEPPSPLASLCLTLVASAQYSYCDILDCKPGLIECTYSRLPPSQSSSLTVYEAILPGSSPIRSCVSQRAHSYAIKPISAKRNDKPILSKATSTKRLCTLLVSICLCHCLTD